MGKWQDSFSKKDKEKKRLQKRQEKQEKMEERKKNAHSSNLEDMLAYVDENGFLIDTPPDPLKKKEIDAESIELGIPRREDVIELVRTGVVEFFNDTKGFGFIREEGSGEKHFVHINGLLDKISENDKVSFEVEKGLKGMNAVKVKKI